MSIARRTSPPVLIFSAFSGLLALLLWAALIATCLNLHSSDAAGNGLAQVYAVFNIFALWLALLVVVAIAAARGSGPVWLKAGAVILCAASCAACIGALQLLTARGDAAAKWPLVVPFLAPPLLIAYGAWALFPAAQIVSAGTAALAMGIPLLALSLAPWPSVVERSNKIEQRRAANEVKFAQQLAAEREAKRQEKLARMARFNQDTPLWDWLPLAERNSEVRDEAIAAIRVLPRRQADAELMLARGMGGPILDVADLELRATPAFCEGARAYMRARADALRPGGDPPPYSAAASRVEMLLPSLSWLAANGCDCRVQVAEVEAAVRAYPDSPERKDALAKLARLH